MKKLLPLLITAIETEEEAQQSEEATIAIENSS